MVEVLNRISMDFFLHVVLERLGVKGWSDLQVVPGGLRCFKSWFCWRIGGVLHFFLGELVVIYSESLKGWVFLGCPLRIEVFDRLSLVRWGVFFSLSLEG